VGTAISAGHWSTARSNARRAVSQLGSPGSRIELMTVASVQISMAGSIAARRAADIEATPKP
jgi:hypothetical protein